MKSLGGARGIGVLAITLGLVVASGMTQVGSRRTVPSDIRPATSKEPDAATRVKVQATYGKLPLHFEPNQGQSDEQVKFLSRGRGYTLFLIPTEAVLALHKPQNHSLAPEFPPPSNSFPSPLPHKHFLAPVSGSPTSPPPNENTLLGERAGVRGLDPEPTQQTVLRMKLLGANPKPRVVGLDELPGKSNYFIGNDPSKRHTGISHYAKVKYKEIYPGIDLVYYGNQRQLEYDFIVAPGADPNIIQLAFEGLPPHPVPLPPGEREPMPSVFAPSPLAGEGRNGGRSGLPLQIDDNGDLIVQTASGEIHLHKPHIYQEINGIKQPIPGGYVVLSPQSSSLVTFQVAAYDSSKPLIIDPVLSYSTYLGGSGRDFGLDIAVDTSNSVYVTGGTASIDFPTVNPIQSTFGGGNSDFFGDTFVTKLDTASNTLIYSTYLGGSNDDRGSSISVDSSGNAYVAGWTFSTDFPTVNPLQAANEGSFDAFVAKLNPSGSALLYSTYLGGSGDDRGSSVNEPGGNNRGGGIAIDSSGNAYVTGATNSTDFPTVNPLQAANRGSFDAFVAKLNSTGSALLYSTYLGGRGDENPFGSNIAVDASGNAYVTGETVSTNFPTVNPLQATFAGGSTVLGGGDAFVAKLNPSGSALLYSTYLGGSGDDRGFGITVDASGNAYVTGLSSSSNFPTTLGTFQDTFAGGSAGLGGGDAFIAKLNPSGSALVYSTYLGGSSDEAGLGITVDTSDNAYVTGPTKSTDFPTMNPSQVANGGLEDAFVAKFNAGGDTLVYSTYLGGSGDERSFGIAVDSSGNAYVTGQTSSSTFPTVNPFQIAPGSAGTFDAFVTKIVDESLSASPTSLAFGEVVIGSTQDLSFTIQNIGEDTLSGTLTEPASPFSIISGGGTLSLESGATQTVTVRFSPTSAGSFGGVVNVTSNGGSANITLNGIGISPSGPALSVCSTTLDFGSVEIGGSKELTCTLTNTGTGTLEGSASTSAPFSLVSGSPFSLTAGQSETLILSFTPSSVGVVEGNVSLDSNGGNQTITLRGEGSEGSVLEVSPTTLNFGGVRVGSSKDLPLTVQNIGVETLSRNTCAPDSFSFVSGDSFSLEAGQSQTLTIRFSPSTTSEFNGTLTFTSDSCTSTNPQPDLAVVLVSGTGLPEQEAVGVAYVVNQASDTVSVIDTSTQQEVIAAIEVGDAPITLALTPDESKAYVVNFGSNDVSVIDTATLQVTQTIPVGLDPQAIVITPDGQHVYVVNEAEESVSVIDLTTDEVLDIIPVLREDPSVLALSRDGTVLYILGAGDNKVSLVDITTNAPGRIETGEDPVAVDFSPEGSRAYIANNTDNTVSVLDTTTFPPTKLDDVEVGEAPRSVAVSPDGTKVYVANFLDNTISVIDTTQEPLQATPQSFEGWEGPWKILTDPKSGGSSEPKALVINRTSNNVGILNLSIDQAESTISVDTSPEEGAFDPELSQAVVTNSVSDTISFIDISGAMVSVSVPVGMQPVAVAVALQTPEVTESPDTDGDLPMADAGPDQIVGSLSRVSLDGTGSSDPQGDPLTFLWTQTEGPSVELSDSTSSTPSFRAPVQLSGSVVLSFELIVNDGQNDSLSDTVAITVQGLRP